MYAKKVAYKTRTVPSHKLQVGSFSAATTPVNGGITQKSALEGNEITLCAHPLPLVHPPLVVATSGRPPFTKHTGVSGYGEGVMWKGGRVPPFVFVINRPPSPVDKVGRGRASQLPESVVHLGISPVELSTTQPTYTYIYIYIYGGIYLRVRVHILIPS